MLNATVTSAVPTQTAIVNSSPTTINLNQYFNDPLVTGTAVLMQTNEGNIPITLDDSQVATTVQNFLYYVNNGEYNNTFIHRVLTESSGGIGIVQGGGYTIDGNAIATAAAIPLQYNVANSQYTIAMARTSAPNSATSEWFFNATDNSSALGPANGGGYAVFGTALYEGEQTINTIYNLTLGTYNTSDGALDTVPTIDGNNQTATASELVVVEQASVVNPLTYTVTSDNPGLVVPTVSGKNLVLSYASGQLGTADITVTATDLGGNSVSSTFEVDVDPVPPPTVVTLGTGASHEVKFKDPNGTAAAAFLTGPGGGTVTLAGVGLTESTSKSGVVTVSGTPSSVSIDATGTTAATTLNIVSPTGRPLLISEISTDGDVRTISAGKVALTGNLTVGGSVANGITLDALNSGTFTVNGSSGAYSLVVGASGGENVSSSEAIKSIQATSVTGSPTITAPSVGKLTVKGQIDANITAGSLGPVSAGTIGTSTWTISGAVSNITASVGITGLDLSAASIGHVTSRQAINASNLISTGNIASIAAAVLSGSKIEAGSPAFGSNGTPSSFAGSATLSTVTIGRGGFSNSIIAAPTLGNLSLGAIGSSNGGTPFGVAGTQINILTARVDGKALSLRKITSEDQVTAAVSKAGITLNDLFLQIV